MVNSTPLSLYPREIPGTHCIGGWLGPRNCLNRCEVISVDSTNIFDFQNFDLLILRLRKCLRINNPLPPVPEDWERSIYIDNM